MTNKLPYTLTTGVVAMREGLQITGDNRELYILAKHDYHSQRIAKGVRRLPWLYVAERLRYREGEPYCEVIKSTFSGIHCFCVDTPELGDTPCLHRLAAILCDDAEAFRVLHWCINNLADGAP